MLAEGIMYLEGKDWVLRAVPTGILQKFERGKALGSPFG